MVVLVLGEDVVIVNVGTLGRDCTLIDGEFDGAELPVSLMATTE
jgi:hypothetical protein